MCASLAGVLFAIDHFQTHKISFEPLSSAQADAGISATVYTERSEVPVQKATDVKDTDTIDKLNSDH